MRKSILFFIFILIFSTGLDAISNDKLNEVIDIHNKTYALLQKQKYQTSLTPKSKSLTP